MRSYSTVPQVGEATVSHARSQMFLWIIFPLLTAVYIVNSRFISRRRHKSPSTIKVVRSRDYSIPYEDNEDIRDDLLWNLDCR